VTVLHHLTAQHTHIQQYALQLSQVLAFNFLIQQYARQLSQVLTFNFLTHNNIQVNAGSKLHPALGPYWAIIKKKQ
jgi:hypothetical protein